MQAGTVSPKSEHIMKVHYVSSSLNGTTIITYSNQLDPWSRLRSKDCEYPFETWDLDPADPGIPLINKLVIKESNEE